MSLESTRTRQRVAVANRLLVVATFGTHLTCPRFRLGFEADTVLLTDARETVDELLERPEVVRLLVHPDRAVRFQYVGQVAYVHCRHALLVEAFNEVAYQRVLCVVTALRPLSVQPSNPFGTVASFAELRLKAGDFVSRLAEPSEQLPPVVEVLVPSSRGTGDEIVCANVEGGFVRSQ